MITTIMPSMIREIGGVEYTGWSFAIYETGSIIAGAAAGRLAVYWTVRSNMIVAAIIFAIGCIDHRACARACPFCSAAACSAASAAAR